MQRNEIIAQKLMDGLTREEQAELLGRLLDAVRGKALKDLLESLEPEVAAMVKGLAPDGPAARGEPVPEASSNARLAEDIEKCAVKTLPLLDRAGKLGLAEESLFFNLCAEIEDSLFPGRRRDPERLEGRAQEKAKPVAGPAPARLQRMIQASRG